MQISSMEIIEPWISANVTGHKYENRIKDGGKKVLAETDCPLLTPKAYIIEEEANDEIELDPL